ncbi:MAG: hypothetical protein CL942_08525 [Desulfovibrio sp.]|nr:hypothetical protein [Desulfovibrio sp.]|tara:strand:+ start:24128 stop:24694 length:567 start_codon:yes stop_codon:yes gene_type:complete
MSRVNVLSQSAESVYVRPARSIGGLVMDVTVEENHNDDLEITDHPVENGANVTDHAFMQPPTVSITAGVSDSGGTSTGDKRSVEAYEKLLELQKKREPFDLITGKRVYKNMLIRSLSTTTDKETENALIFTAELREVIMATVQAVSIPRSRQRRGMATGGTDSTGQKQLESKPQQSSALKDGLKGLFG